MEKKDDQRNKKLATDKKRMEQLYSDQNTCQAIVNPACSKYKVLKTLKVPKALIAAVGMSVKYEGCDDTTNLYTTFAHLTDIERSERTNYCVPSK